MNIARDLSGLSVPILFKYEHGFFWRNVLIVNYDGEHMTARFSVSAGVKMEN